MRRRIAALACAAALGCGSAQQKDGADTGFACAELTSRLCATAGRETPTCAELASALQLLPESACRVGLEDVGTSIAKLEERALRCTELVDRLCADLGADSTACQRVRGDAAGLPSDRCERMLSHYEATLASIREQDAASDPLDAEQQRALVAGSPPSLGPADAAVTVVAFVDFECPHCARFAPVFAELRERHGARVRFVVRQLPLEMHAHARLAAEAALAAHEQGRFWEMHDALYDREASLDRAGLERVAVTIGLDVGRFRDALDSGRPRAAVEADLALARAAAVNGTPTLFVNGARVEDASDPDAIERLIGGAIGG
jgi:protein-disulfide isomerase